MATFKCKICGGNIEVGETTTFATCEYCGVTSTLPKVDDQRQLNLFNRANNLRRQNDFDKAVAAYENILNLGESSAEAHWGMVLSRYGIEYVEDPATKQRIPTCHRVQSESILKDADYLAALKNAEDSYTKSLYQDEAKRIAEIQKGILKISSKEKPYDVFICYKETGNGNRRTKDSALAQDLYYALEKEGHRVFFSRISLESKLGQEYEPYIFNALNTAKVMLVLGTKPEYFNAVWVKNEWSRFLALMKKDSSRLLIPCYRDMDAYDLPEEMAMLQSQDMGRIGFVQDILHGIKKVVGDNKGADSAKAGASQTAIGSSSCTVTAQSTAAPGVESLMKRGRLFLEDSDWKQAEDYFNKVLDIDPEYAPAYRGLLCADLKIPTEPDLVKHKEPLDDISHYQKALRFADTEYRAKLAGYNEAIKRRIAEEEGQEQQRFIRLERIVKNIGLSTAEKQVATLPQDGFVSVSGKRHRITLNANGTVKGEGCKIEQLCTSVAIDLAGRHHNNRYKTLYDYASSERNNELWVGIGNKKWIDINKKGAEATRSQSEQADFYWFKTERDIIAIATGDYHIALMKSYDVYAYGRNNYRQCETSSFGSVHAIAAAGDYTIGLKKDGTVVATGNYIRDITQWKNIVMIHASSKGVIGLKSDDTFVVASNKYGTLQGSEDEIVKQINEKIRQYEEEKRIEEQQRIEEQERIEKQRLAEQKRQEEERRKKEQSKEWARQGLCRYCGGKLTFFTGRCKSCGEYANFGT